MLKFTVTEDHLKLIRNFYVGWNDCETGAPEIDPKRPYGNSYVPGDVGDILGWERNEDGELTEDQEAEAYQVHSETETVLQIVLSVGAFEPGLYERVHAYSNEWVYVGDAG